MLKQNSKPLYSTLASATLALGLANSAYAQDRCPTNFPAQITRISDDAKAQIINLDGMLPDQKLVDLSSEPCEDKIRGIFENPNYSQFGLTYKYTNCQADTSSMLNTSATPDTAPISVMATPTYGTIAVTTVDAHIFQTNLGEYRLATTQNLDPDRTTVNYEIQNLLLPTTGESTQPFNTRLQKSTTSLFTGEGLAPELITIDGTTTFDAQVHIGVISPDNREDEDPNGTWVRLDAVNCRESEKAIVVQSTDLNGYPVAGQVWIITESNLRPRTYVTELKLTTDGDGSLRWTNCGPSSDTRYATPIRDTNGVYINTIGKPITFEVPGAGLMTFILAPDETNPSQGQNTFGTALYSLSGPLPVCFGITCGNNEYCDPGTGTCRVPDTIDPCEDVVCEPEEVCIEGTCALDEEADAGDADLPEDTGLDTDIETDADMSDTDATDDADTEDADTEVEPDAEPDVPEGDAGHGSSEDADIPDYRDPYHPDNNGNPDTGVCVRVATECKPGEQMVNNGDECACAPIDTPDLTPDTGIDSGNNEQPPTSKPKEEGCTTAPGNIQSRTNLLALSLLALALRRRKKAA